MTQGYRSTFARSRRLDMNWLNFRMPPNSVAPCAHPRAAPGSSAQRGVTASLHPCPHLRRPCPKKGGLRALQAAKSGTWSEESGATSPRPPMSPSAQTMSRKKRPTRPPRQPKVGHGARDCAPTTHDAPAPSPGYGGVERMPWTQSRSRSRRCGRSLRLAERPPWSRRRSMSWPEIRVSARRSIASFDRSTGSSTSEKS